jgi:PAS domain S-box-containing protein
MCTVVLVGAVLGLEVFRERAETLVVERTRELRASEQTYRNQFSGNSAVMLLVDPRTSAIIDGNAAALDFYGYSREQLLAMSIADINLPPTAEAPAAAGSVSPPQGRRLQCRHRLADGSVRDVEVSSSLIRTGERELVHSIVFDVTERSQATQALAASESKLRAILDHSSDAIGVHVGGIWETCNPAAVRLFGVSSEKELIGSSMLGVIAESEKARIGGYVGRRAVDGAAPTNYVTRGLRADGAEFDMEVALSSFTWGGRRHVLVLLRDITEKKRMEAHLLSTQRMEAVGALSSGIAHDLNNILTPVLMAPGLLKEIVKDERGLELLDMIEQGAKRGAGIIRQLLTFSRGSGGERVPLQVRRLVNEIGGFVREMFPRNITLRTELGPDLLPILGDATQLHQLLLNLCVNARDAMPNGGTLIMSALNVVVGAEEAGANPPAKPGPHVLVSITDTGEGMAPEIIGRIFEPFFTTKEFGKGTGLGLSTALGIVRSHGGFITVTSAPGAGAQFCVYLPAAPAEAPQAPAEPAAEPQAGQGELILVVDDEPSVCRATRIVLERHGYRVATAANGEDALAVFRSQGREISLVLTDIMMPAMDGLALIGELRRMRSDVKIVATTGMISADKLRELATLGVTELLQKPSGPNEMLAVVGRALPR